MTAINEEECDGSSASTTDERPTHQGPRHFTEEGTAFVEFDVEAIHEQLICPLCEGLYKDPYTTTKCFHTFCKSCLVLAVTDTDCYTCPTCKMYLGKDYSKFALPDRMLQNLIDKVLFPDLASRDAAVERKFYRKRGIHMLSRSDNKGHDEPEATSPGQSTATREVATRDVERINNSAEQGDSGANLIIHLVPDPQATDDCRMEPLDHPFVQTKGTISVAVLKKYLHQVLAQQNRSKPHTTSPNCKKKSLPIANDQLRKMRPVEIRCNGVPLGNELSATFVLKTVWMETKSELILTYLFE